MGFVSQAHPDQQNTVLVRRPHNPRVYAQRASASRQNVKKSIVTRLPEIIRPAYAPAVVARFQKNTATISGKNWTTAP